MKTDLVTTSEYQRLIGQLVDYAATDKTIIIVLTGRTDPDLKMRLDKFAENENNGWQVWVREANIHIVEKKNG